MDDTKINDHVENLQRQIEVLRDDFQQLETLFHSMNETLETRIENLTDEVKEIIKARFSD